MKFRLVAMLGLLALALFACQSSQPAPAQQAGREIPKPAPTLAQAINEATDLGPAGPSTIVRKRRPLACTMCWLAVT